MGTAKLFPSVLRQKKTLEIQQGEIGLTVAWRDKRIEV